MRDALQDLHLPQNMKIFVDYHALKRARYIVSDKLTSY